MINPRFYLTAAISAAVACGVWYGLNQADSGQAEPVAGEVTVEDLIDFYQAMDHDEKMKAVKAAAAATDDATDQRVTKRRVAGAFSQRRRGRLQRGGLRAQRLAAVIDGTLSIFLIVAVGQFLRSCAQQLRQSVFRADRPCPVRC